MATNVFGKPHHLRGRRLLDAFGIFARTGQTRMKRHWVDDLNISYIAEGHAKRGGLVVVTNGVVAYTPPAVGLRSRHVFYYLGFGTARWVGTNVGTVTVNIIGTNRRLLVSLCETTRPSRWVWVCTGRHAA